MSNFKPLPYHPDAKPAIDPMIRLFEWIGPRYPKSLLLYTLAREAINPIIELGVYHGQGTIPLALGSRDGHNAVIYPVDPFIQTSGWIGESYGPNDLDVFKANMLAMGLDHIKPVLKKSEALSKQWIQPYDLLFWDIGGERLIDDYLDWYELCAPGGLIVVKDTPDWKFGFVYVLEHALKNGFERAFGNPDAMMWGLRRL